MPDRDAKGLTKQLRNGGAEPIDSPDNGSHIAGRLDWVMGKIVDDKLFLGTSRKPDDTLQKAEYLNLKLANRHGLITGATGTG